MKYNSTNTDTILSRKLIGKKGHKIKQDLQLKLNEQEKMLDLINISISHCNTQIELLQGKADKESDVLYKTKLIDQRIVFEDNKKIWNISGFINLISMDIKTTQIGMYFTETDWHKRFYARQICTIMYESTDDIFELLGKEFKDLVSNRIDISPFEYELRDIRSRLNKFKTNHSAYLQKIRNYTAAHKDKDVLIQSDIISSISWTNIIEITMEFETIINDFGSFLQKLIKQGLINLKGSPVGLREL